MPKACIICPVCGVHKERFVYSETRVYYCSGKCKGIDFKSRMQGESNPNFGNKWNEDSRTKASIRVSESMKDPEVRWNAGKANRGRKFSDEVRANMSKARLGKPTKPASEKTKALIGASSRKRWEDPSYRENYRKRRVESGDWTPIHMKTSWERYFILSSWKSSMVEFLESSKLTEFKQIGMFSAKNSKGLVRDHVFPRYAGLKLKVFPVVLSHPCNCNFILHGENVSKGFRDRGLSTEELKIALKDLFSRIKVWKGLWEFHEESLKLINLYEAGYRWHDMEVPLWSFRKMYS